MASAAAYACPVVAAAAARPPQDPWRRRSCASARKKRRTWIPMCLGKDSTSQSACASSRRSLNPKYRSWLWPHRRRIVEEWGHDELARCRRRSTRVLARQSWWQLPNSQAGGLFQRGGMLLARSVALFVITVLSGVVALQLRGKAQAYIEAKLLPPIASLLGARLAREVELGSVQRVSPLGITLGPCSIGPHEKEFSCGELPNVKIRIRPFRSIQRGQLTADVILSQPHFLICQKQDWTWLGLPAPADKLVKRCTPDAELNSRTKTRRLAKQSIGTRLAEERNSSAWNSAKMGYTLPVSSNGEEERRDRFNASQTDAEFMEDGIEFEEGLAGNKEHSGSMRIGFWEPLYGAKIWVKDRIKRQSASSAEMTRLRERNLKRSAAKACLFFQKKYSGELSPALSDNHEDASALNERTDDGTTVKASHLSHTGVSCDLKTPLKPVPAVMPLRRSLNVVADEHHWRNELNRFLISCPEAGLNGNFIFEESSGHPLDEGTYKVVESLQDETKSMKNVLNAMDDMNVSDALPDVENRGTPLGEFVSAENRGHSNSKYMGSKILEQAERTNGAELGETSLPIALESVYFRDGTLMLLAYGDHESRMMDEVNGHVKFGNDYQQINVQVKGKPKVWRTSNSIGDGLLNVIVKVDVGQQKWNVKVKARNLFAPLLERLLEVPLDWYHGFVNGEVQVWMDKDDRFPNLGGKVNVKDLSFKIWESPSAFKEVNGTLFFQGQRAFLHNTHGFYGAIPLSVSGDMDLNPEIGEFRLSCQVAGIEVNALMDTLNAHPPPFSIAGAVKGVVYCRGPLDAPIFEGSGETLKNQMGLDLTFDSPPSVACDSIKRNLQRGAAAAYDRVAFSSASANFTFDTDNCMANIYGIRATPVGGGEIRGAGDMWICPEAEADPTAIRIDCSGYVMVDDVIQSYASDALQPSLFGAMHGEAKVRGSLVTPTFDIKWVTPDAKGPFNGARGEIAISDEAISLNSSSFTFDLYTKVLTSHIPASTKNNKPTGLPTVEGIDVDARLRGFDLMGLVTSTFLIPSDATQMKVSGRVKVQGRLADFKDRLSAEANTQNVLHKKTGIVGDVSLWGIKLNQLLVASQLAGSLELSPSSFKLYTAGRGKDHLIVQISQGSRTDANEGLHFSLQRGQLQVDISHSPQSSAKLEIRNLLLDELEVSSLRGTMQKVDIQLNLQKRRGHGCLSVRRPRFSGIHGELLDVSARWSGDVVTLEKSLLEQANSRYELQGEYVLPGSRDKGTRVKEDEGMWEKVMAGQLGNVMSSLGRWRLRLEVPRAELADMLPVARLLSRSSDPAVVSRSKELFLQGVEKAAFIANNLKQEIEYIRKDNGVFMHEEGLPNSVPLPGLAELNGRWHGTLEASGGGNSDTTANFDLHGENWEWGTYNIQSAIAAGSYCYADGLRLEKVFLQKDTATLHADGTTLGPNSNLHFALLNFPVDLVPPIMRAIQSSSVEPLRSSTRHRALIKGVLHMEGDLRGDYNKPECDVQVRLLDGAIGGINLSRAEVAASVTSANQFIFNARLEPVVHAGHVHVRGSIPLGSKFLDRESNSASLRNTSMKKKNLGKANDNNERLYDKEWPVLTSPDWDFIETGALYVDATVKDSGMMLLAAVTPNVSWLQGNADVRLQVRGTSEQPKIDGMAVFHKVAISSPVLPRPISNLGGTVAVKDNELFVEGVEGRVGKRGRVVVKGRLPLKLNEGPGSGDNIELKAESLEVRAKNTFSGQVDGQLWVMGSLLDPELTGVVKLSHGEAYLSQERSTKATASTIPRALTDLEFVKEESHKPQLPVAVRLKGLKLQLGPELRMVYPLILNFAVNGELELYGFADPDRVRPKGVLTFENGDVNLVATQVRLNKDYLNRAKFEPEQGLDPTLDLALVGIHWQLKVQGRAQNWQDSLVLTSARSGEQDALTRIEAAKLFENQLVDSLLEGNGQFAFKKLAAATVETLMPKIETKGEFGQARWRLVYAPQIPNLLSLDPTTDPFKSLANLSFGTEVEVQLGRHLQASVVRQLKESEMATHWTLIYHLNNKLRIVFSSVPSVDNRLLFEYSASS